MNAAKQYLSYDIAVFQWLMSYHKYPMTAHVITLWHKHATSLTMSVSAMSFLIEIVFILKEIKSHFKGSFDKDNLTLVGISYEIHETWQSLVSYEMITSVRSCILVQYLFDYETKIFFLQNYWESLDPSYKMAVDFLD